MTTPRADGRILTFYSFKGGTGRSMAAANVACLLGRVATESQERVLLMDWDLEAPGLHRYFEVDDSKGKGPRAGVIDYFLKLRSLLLGTGGAAFYQSLDGDDGWRALDSALPFADYVVQVSQGVDLVPAGVMNDGYAERVSDFDWPEFYTKHPAVFGALRALLAFKYQYTLLDSRTGLTDVSGICTMLLPERLICVFTPNRQSLEGVIDLARRATAYRAESLDPRPLRVIPLPSRVEPFAAEDLRKVWRRRYQHAFESLFRESYGLDTCDLTQYFDDVVIPHVSDFAYGERVVVLEGREESFSLARAYRLLTDAITTSTPPWEQTVASGKSPAPAQQGLGRHLALELVAEADAKRLVTEPLKAWKDGGHVDGLLLGGRELDDGLSWAESAENFDRAEVAFLAKSAKRQVGSLRKLITRSSITAAAAVLATTVAVALRERTLGDVRVQAATAQTQWQNAAKEQQNCATKLREQSGQSGDLNGKVAHLSSQLGAVENELKTCKETGTASALAACTSQLSKINKVVEIAQAAQTLATQNLSQCSTSKSKLSELVAQREKEVQVAKANYARCKASAPTAMPPAQPPAE